MAPTLTMAHLSCLQTRLSTPTRIAAGYEVEIYRVLTEEEVVGSEQLSDGSCADCVHGAWLEVHQYGARHVLGIAALVEVDVDALNL